MCQFWHQLDGWPDASPGLLALRASASRQVILGTLSNGSARLLVDVARHASLPWDIVFSGDLLKSYKPNAKMYLGASAMAPIPLPALTGTTQATHISIMEGCPAAADPPTAGDVQRSMDAKRRAEQAFEAAPEGTSLKPEQARTFNRNSKTLDTSIGRVNHPLRLIPNAHGKNVPRTIAGVNGAPATTFDAIRSSAQFQQLSPAQVKGWCTLYGIAKDVDDGDSPKMKAEASRERLARLKEHFYETSWDEDPESREDEPEAE
ncbi:haloacid dehalogenase [Pseudohyphozyma bogoriensis]|nr:haloacid dehalogenase [Pseudohyphozyma bogoriensis]